MRRRFESREQSATEQLARLLHWNDGPHNIDEVELSDLTERVIQELSEYDYESELPNSLRGIVTDYLGDRTARRVSRRRAVKGRGTRNEFDSYPQYSGGGRYSRRGSFKRASTTTDDLIKWAPEFGYVIIEVQPDRGKIHTQPDGKFGRYGVDVSLSYGGEFLVQTTSWGEVPSRDIDTVIDSYESAKHFADLLNSVDVSSLSPYYFRG